jgi:hypothetical protein
MIESSSQLSTKIFTPDGIPFLFRFWNKEHDTDSYNYNYVSRHVRGSRDFELAHPRADSTTTE